VSGGKFDDDHNAELATDDNPETYATAVPTNPGARVTLICKFKREYTVRNVVTWIPKDKADVPAAIYKGDQQTRGLSTLNGNGKRQQQMMNTQGTEIRLEKDGEIHLAEIEVHVQPSSFFQGMNLGFISSN
jgi:hypothetical protein